MPPLNREYSADPVTGMLAEVMTISSSSNTRSGLTDLCAHGRGHHTPGVLPWGAPPRERRLSIDGTREPLAVQGRRLVQGGSRPADFPIQSPRAPLIQGRGAINHESVAASVNLPNVLRGPIAGRGAALPEGAVRPAAQASCVNSATIPKVSAQRETNAMRWRARRSTISAFSILCDRFPDSTVPRRGTPS